MMIKALGALLGLAGALTLRGTVFNASLEPEDNSGITGSARVETFGNDSAQAQITVNGAKPNTMLAWGIQTGDCDKPGTATGAQASYPNIQIDSTGTGTASATVRPGVNESGDHALVVHSGDMSGKVAACGELEKAP